MCLTNQLEALAPIHSKEVDAETRKLPVGLQPRRDLEVDHKVGPEVCRSRDASSSHGPCPALMSRTKTIPVTKVPQRIVETTRANSVHRVTSAGSASVEIPVLLALRRRTTEIRA